jgi:hypothetical protein
MENSRLVGTGSLDLACTRDTVEAGLYLPQSWGGEECSISKAISDVTL